jgi:hypothetical protein
MTPELEKKIHETYPGIFPKPDKPIEEFTTGWSIEHDDGWYGIIDAMCYAMTNLYVTRMQIDESLAKTLGISPHHQRDGVAPEYFLIVQPPQVIARQVKEKLGTLRFYYELEFEPRFQELAYGDPPLHEARLIANRYHSFIGGIVHLAEVLSSRTCEKTGKEGELHGNYEGNGWKKTLNKEFAKTDEFYASRNYVPLADLPPSHENRFRIKIR